MASAERSVGVRNGGAALWFSSLASLDFTVHLFSAAETFLLLKLGGLFRASNVRALSWFQAGNSCAAVMIRIRYIMEYLGIRPYCRLYCRRFRSGTEGKWCPTPRGGTRKLELPA